MSDVGPFKQTIKMIETRTESLRGIFHGEMQLTRPTVASGTFYKGESQNVAYIVLRKEIALNIPPAKGR
jgi:hypothetical protein